MPSTSPSARSAVSGSRVPGAAGREHGIDQIRGMAVLLVVIAHVRSIPIGVGVDVNSELLVMFTKEFHTFRMPVLLVLHLTWLRGRNPFRVLGLDLRRPGRDLAWGLGLFAAIGLGTLGVYAAGRALGITTAIVGSALGESWYQVPVLLLSALRHGLLEEVIVGAWLVDRLGYLQRLRAAGLAHDPAPAVPSSWVSAEGLYLPTRVAVVVLALALLRGAYHLYQGIGPGVGNALMGVVFALVFLRVRRVMPLVIAHALLDAVGFVGYPLLARAGLLG